MCRRKEQQNFTVDGITSQTDGSVYNKAGNKTGFLILSAPISIYINFYFYFLFCKYSAVYSRHIFPAAAAAAFRIEGFEPVFLAG